MAAVSSRWHCAHRPVACVNAASGWFVSLAGLARLTITAATMRLLPITNAMKIDLKGIWLPVARAAI